MTQATSVPILVFLGLSVLDFGPMYAIDVGQTYVRQMHRLMYLPIRDEGITTIVCCWLQLSQIWLRKNLSEPDLATLVEIGRFLVTTGQNCSIPLAQAQLVGRQEGHLASKTLGFGLLVVIL